MVGPKVEEVIAEVAALAEMCREKRIQHVEVVLPAAGVVRLSIHELALKAAAVQNSPQPRTSDPPADPSAIEDQRRFGSGSR